MQVRLRGRGASVRGMDAHGTGEFHPGKEHTLASTATLRRLRRPSVRRLWLWSCRGRWDSRCRLFVPALTEGEHPN